MQNEDFELVIDQEITRIYGRKLSYRVKYKIIHKNWKNRRNYFSTYKIRIMILEPIFDWSKRNEIALETYAGNSILLGSEDEVILFMLAFA